MTISIYPGADGTFLLYEDDGMSFNYRKGEWLGVQIEWNDTRRVLELRLADGSRMLSARRRVFDVKLGESTRPVVFEGQPVEVKF